MYNLVCLIMRVCKNNVHLHIRLGISDLPYKECFWRFRSVFLKKKYSQFVLRKGIKELKWQDQSVSVCK